MRRLCLLLVLFHLLSSWALAGFTLSYAYFVADAGVDTTVGSDVQHDEGGAPVGVLASAGAEGSGAAASVEAALGSVASWSAVTFQPGVVGGAGSAAGSAVVGLTSTTPWILGLQTVAIVPDVPPGVAVAAAAAQVQDLGGNPLYTYSLVADGPTASQTFAAGTYNVVLFATTLAGVGEPADSVLELFSATRLDATVAIVPVPGAILLALLGTGGTVLLRRKLA